MLPFFHPTTVLFVDDDALFLDSCKFRYGSNFRCASTRSPREAVNLLRSSVDKWTEQIRHILPRSTMSWDDAVEAGRSLITIDSQAIATLARNTDRSQMISVAIVDFAMPSMSGLELFQEVQNLPIGKILLTGKAGSEVAIEAFNNGLIDKFIIKQHPDVSKTLLSEVDRLQQKFFHNVANQILPYHQGSRHAFLQDPAMQAHLEKVAKSCGAVEHFFSGDPLGVIFIDAVGDKVGVFVVDEDQMQAHREVASFLGAPEQLLERLAGGETLPMFNTSTRYYDTSLQRSWSNHLLDATRVYGESSSWWVAQTKCLF